ncbi:threonine-phosphate decarboxylase CobD [Halomonas sp. SIMBA_159]
MGVGVDTDTDMTGNTALESVNDWPSHGGQAAALLQRFGLPADHPLEDFSANLNPHGPPSWVAHFLAERIHQLDQYPEPSYYAARQAIAAQEGVSVDQVLLTNGGAEAIFLAAAHHAGQRGLIVIPTFGEYARACAAHRLTVTEHALTGPAFEVDAGELQASAAEADVVFLCRPNNPTGTVVPVAVIEGLLAGLAPTASLVVDEAFIDLALAAEPLTPLLARHPQLVLLRSLTKFFTLPGLRLGYVVAHPSHIERLASQQPPWSVNHFAAELVAPLLADTEFATRTQQWLASEQPRMASALAAQGCEVVPSQSCFLLVRPGDALQRRGVTSGALFERLLKQGMLVRHTHSFPGLDGGWLRVAVRDSGANDRLLQVLNDCLC